MTHTPITHAHVTLAPGAIAHYGPFVMNTREEILAAIDDYQAGKLGIIPADQLAPRNFA